jgi:glycosyltransferase involved in cell wall biosynthesis
MHFPKVLIIGQYFDNKSGSGITLTNLFDGWKKENIAVVAIFRTDPGYSVTDNLYNIGDEEVKKTFPFNISSRKGGLKSGVLMQENKDKQYVSSSSIQSIKNENLKDFILNTTGQIHRRQNLVISEKLLLWINEFSPDIIYTQLSSFTLIKFVKAIQYQINKPLVIHIMDDWPVTITKLQKGLFRRYWAYKIDREFRGLLQRSSVLMSISEAMSEAYSSRYGRTFIPFHNPINIQEWLPYSKSDYSFTRPFKVLYTGRIGTANSKSLSFISESINSLNQFENKIELDIYSSEAQSHHAELLRDFKGVNVKNPVPYEIMPSLLGSYDLLILPLDFDNDGISFAQYSMPTKASEYMISGTPILVFASMLTALAKYASKAGWAYVVSEQKHDLLEDAFNQLIESEELRKMISRKAIAVAIQNENAIHVRENFRKSLVV